MAATPKKVFDVTKPGQSSPDASSRPVIVGHKPSVKDPMVAVAATAEKSDKPQTAPTLAPGKRVVVEPITKGPQETEPASSSRSASDDVQSKPVVQPPPTPQNSQAVAEADAAKEAERKKEDEKAQAERQAAETAQSEHVQELISKKTYAVKVGHVRRKKPSKLLTLSLLALLSLLAAGYLLLDAQILKNSYQLPYEFFKDETQTTGAETAQTTIARYSDAAMQGGITVKYPSTWGTATLNAAGDLVFTDDNYSIKYLKSGETDLFFTAAEGMEKEKARIEQAASSYQSQSLEQAQAADRVEPIHIVIVPEGNLAYTSWDVCGESVLYTVAIAPVPETTDYVMFYERKEVITVGIEEAASCDDAISKAYTTPKPDLQDVLALTSTEHDPWLEDVKVMLASVKE